jgi:hypothetical protein
MSDAEKVGGFAFDWGSDYEEKLRLNRHRARLVAALNGIQAESIEAENIRLEIKLVRELERVELRMFELRHMGGDERSLAAKERLGWPTEAT